MDFAHSEPLSVGAELEWQILKSENYDLTDGILKLMEHYPASKHVKPEFIQNTVEIVSSVCNSVAELHEGILPVVADVHAHCRDLGMRLCGAGTHAFGRQMALVTPLPRYKNLAASTGYLAHTTLTFGTHIHVGMPSAHIAIETMRRLKPYIPILIAISASSPFWRGYYTGFAAYRHRIVAATRSYGIPPTFDDWADYTQFFEAMQRAKVMKTFRDVHWDIRPHPDFGTLEIRCMDMQPTVQDAMALAAFVRALAADVMRDPQHGKLPRELPPWFEKENHFQASRLGLKAPYLTDDKGDVLPLGEIFTKVLDRVRRAAQDLGETAYIDHLVRRVETGLSYERQIKTFERTGSAQAVTKELVAELEEELAAATSPVPAS